MKKCIKEFVHRGLLAAWGGPVVWAIVYGILYRTGQVTRMPMDKVVTEILTVTLLAFLAGGVNTVYQIERLPLFTAILIHGGVLYLSYILIYLFNGWLAMEPRALVIFSIWFLLGYGLIWTGIYCSARRRTKAMNKKLASLQAHETK